MIPDGATQKGKMRILNIQAVVKVIAQMSPEKKWEKEREESLVMATATKLLIDGEVDGSETVAKVIELETWHKALLAYAELCGDFIRVQARAVELCDLLGDMVPEGSEILARVAIPHYSHSIARIMDKFVQLTQIGQYGDEITFAQVAGDLWDLILMHSRLMETKAMGEMRKTAQGRNEQQIDRALAHSEVSAFKHWTLLKHGHGVIDFCGCEDQDEPCANLFRDRYEPGVKWPKGEKRIALAPGGYTLLTQDMPGLHVSQLTVHDFHLWEQKPPLSAPFPRRKKGSKEQ